MDLGRGEVVQALMKSLVIVKDKVIAQPSQESRDSLVVKQVKMFIFDSTPQSFDENVVQSPTPTIHADLNAGLFYLVSEDLGCELNALIGIENFRLSEGQGLLQGNQTEVTIQGVG